MWNLVSFGPCGLYVIERCPYYRGVRKERFDSTNKWIVIYLEFEITWSCLLTLSYKSLLRMIDGSSCPMPDDESRALDIYKSNTLINMGIITGMAQALRFLFFSSPMVPRAPRSSPVSCSLKGLLMRQAGEHNSTETDTNGIFLVFIKLW